MSEDKHDTHRCFTPEKQTLKLETKTEAFLKVLLSLFFKHPTGLFIS